MLTTRNLWLCLSIATPSIAAAGPSLHMRPRVAQAADAAPAEPPTAEPPRPSTSSVGEEVIHVVDKSPEHALFTGRAPVSVITHEDIATTGRATLGEILQALPSQANAGNAQLNAHGDGATRINLRGLGTARTLTLLNGRRIVNAGLGADNAVDVNMIPIAMIERVEILKDGASTRYGADAVGGVVNIITRPKYDGVDVSLLTSTSQHGDGMEYDASGVTGFTTKAQDTYLVLSGGYQHHDPVFARDRSFSEFQQAYDFASKMARPYLSPITPSGRLVVPAGATPPAGCTSSVCKQLPNGSWANFDNATDLYNEASANYLYTPSTRWNLFATGGNNINSSLSMFVEGLYMHRDSARALDAAPFDAGAVISKDSLYNPIGADITDYRRRLTELGPRTYGDEVNMTRLVLGIRGDLPATWGAVGGWPYEVSFNWGNVASTTYSNGQFNTFKAKDLLGPSMLDADGTPICVRVPGDPSTKIQYMLFAANPKGDHTPYFVPCVPLNILAGPGKIDKAQIAPLLLDTSSPGTDRQEAFLATTGGKLADLPNHGEITVTAGADYRHEVGTHDPSSAANTGYTTETQAFATDYRYHIYEAFGDVAITPIIDRGFAKRVELDLGARVLDQHAFGFDVTYKVGALLQTDAGLTARATWATAWRTPSIFELEGGRTGIPTSVEDPCDTQPPSVGGGSKTLESKVQAQCTAQGVPTGAQFASNQLTAVIGGNDHLQPESSTTATIGVIYEPPPIPGLAVSVDYWHIAIDDAIEALQAQTLLANCYERGIASSCQQIQRDPDTHRINAIDRTLRNFNQTSSSGLDLALLYDATLAELGHLHTTLEAQYLFNYDLDTGDQVVHGAGYYDLGAYPHLRANLSSRWAHPSGPTAGFSLRYVGNYLECAGDDCNDAAHRADFSHQVDRYFKLDLFGGYDFGSRAGRTSLQLGVNNVINATPPTVYNASESNSDAATYDFVGRVVYVRMSQLF